MRLIKNNLNIIKNALSDDVIVVAVSKTKPTDEIMKIYDQGHIDFGENKVQELLIKEKELPKNINWHMIGHLQRNKVRSIIPFVYLIHSVDSLRLINKINEEGKKINKKIKVLLQVKISDAVSKYGFGLFEIEKILNSKVLDNHKYVKVVGLMGMATFTNNETIIEKEFNELQKIYDKYKNTHKFKTLSMGMSGDYKIAIKNGSNMVRLGSVIFGLRG
jgi:pyridoxal phosphate enzyme (YggS family)